ncbi:hypothetical protein nbrc107696_28260 [Gordonia spumicola]|uniref:DUF732 domain-containing protein n=1 Tax=Gordonia spumicola TaxID=589161 RepID=A0A7I9VBH7_9ACTN|nr:hypothetical protein [Gordonia spumicola]GEE02380.1 hypothetical protein nbrc107696_28260 [Gordonia spumicola]
MRASHLLSAAIVAGAATLVVAPIAHANPSTTQSTSPSTAPSDADKVEPSIPLQVPEGAFGYIATRGATKWLADRDLPSLIKSLPVPPSFRESNNGMASIIKAELTAAEETPGACVQIIITPAPKQGGLFTYGFFAVEKQYCPS